ncbi:MAG: hypothetical protein PHY02_07520 [Phycisphaerae bacterium]|nr:hypothetical protein [Phycisphaerae bacterium]
MDNKLQFTSDERRVTSHESRKIVGSAIILTVVLTSILAIIGMMFIMIARVDRMATSNISENKELNYAVESIIDRISQELASDVPGMPKGATVQEYYDYPGDEDKWLASIEPYKGDANNYYWRQISDVTGYLHNRFFLTQNINVDPPGTRKVIREYPDIELDSNGDLENQLADADGDGIADSKWIELDDITSDKGKPIYAAIRIIDNGGMINVNTAYEFDPASSDASRVDGSSQMQIDLDEILRGTDTISNLHNARNPDNKSYSDYQDELIWRIEDPYDDYLPFDISDELELKYRYCIDSKCVSRFEDEDPCTSDAYGAPGGLYDSSDNWGLDDWKPRITNPDYSDKTDRRHFLTTYNMDRIIKPSGNEAMVNINNDSNTAIYEAIVDALGTSYPNPDAVAAQLTVNLIDCVDGPTSSIPDSDNKVSTYRTPDNSVYYGFEQPCVYISELTRKFKPRSGTGSWTFPTDFDLSYAIELHKPYPEDDHPVVGEWRLDIQYYGTVDIIWSGTKSFHVIYFEGPESTPFNISFTGDNYPDIGPPHPQTITLGSYGVKVVWPGSVIELQRKIGSDPAYWLTVDAVTVTGFDASVWENVTNTAQSMQRDITKHKCIRRLWDPALTLRTPNLGDYNAYPPSGTGDSIYIQAHPANRDFTNVGEIGTIFRKKAYDIGSADTEDTARLNLADPDYQDLFQYLTIFEPQMDNINNDGDGKTLSDPVGWVDETDLDKSPEWEVPGKININTAPWYVLAQLPWVSQRKSGYNNTALAHAIVACRDKTKIPCGEPNDYGVRPGAAGFESIGRLCDVNLGADLNYHIDYYGIDDANQTEFPDLTPDNAPDDFEERDVIFARISNLVTVRSDVFTAYILVRVCSGIGKDKDGNPIVEGPQKRVIAILDRSDVYRNPDYPATSLVPYFGKVKIRAMQLVPDPR